MLGIDPSNFKLPDNSIIKQFEDIRKLLNPSTWEKADKLADEIMPKLDDFVKSLLKGSFKDLFPKDREIEKIKKIRDAIFPVDPSGTLDKTFVDRIKGADKAKYSLLKKEADKLRAAWTQAYIDQSKQYPKIERFYKENIDKYSEFIEKHKADPEKVTNPHPKNIRVTAACSQSDGSTPDYTDYNEKKSIGIYIKNLSKAIKDTQCFDDAIDQVDKIVTLQKGKLVNGEPFQPMISKPVSTPRSNRNSLKKSDNNNIQVKRIIIFIHSYDGTPKAKNDIDELKKNYREESVKTYANSKDPNKNKQYRVDTIITVPPPTPKEEAKGITHRDKIKKAFEEAKIFVEREKRKARESALIKDLDPKQAEEALKFEGVAHWSGHGVSDDTKESKGDGKYLEGSKEFKFITEHEGNKVVTEKEIKAWEKEYLKSFRYFIQSVEACESGALIAKNNENNFDKTCLAYG